MSKEPQLASLRRAYKRELKKSDVRFDKLIRTVEEIVQRRIDKLFASAGG